MALLKRKPQIEPTPQWTTDDEISYLCGIGLYRMNSSSAPVKDRIALLKNYINAASLRANWGEMDKSRVISYARQRLLALEIQTG